MLSYYQQIMYIGKLYSLVHLSNVLTLNILHTLRELSLNPCFTIFIWMRELLLLKCLSALK